MPTSSPIETKLKTSLHESLHEHHLETAGEVVNYRDSWKIFRIMSEFVDGYQFLEKFQREVIILGSARLAPNTKYYKIAEQLGKLLAKSGFTTVTGGGPGIMEAANKGAYEGGGESVGLNIQLPFEQRINAYVKQSTAFYYFFTRKVMLTSPGNAFVFFPGGFGTLDELFEVVDYMEIGQMDKAPVVLVGREFWEPLVHFIRSGAMTKVKAVGENDMENWHVVDTAEEAFELVKDVKDRPNVCNNDPSNPLCHEGPTDWKIFRIMAELVEGFEFLTKVQHDVTVLGTKSILPTSKLYNSAYEVGKLLAQNKFMVVSGGGPGVMEAVSKGSYEAGGESVGINMRLNGHERVNKYLTMSRGFVFPYVRKLIITSPSKAFVFFPGGFGTLHQLFELLTLIETKKQAELPIVLYGKSYWQPLLDFIHQLYTTFRTISQIDETYLQVVDSPEDLLPIISKL